MNQVVSLTQNRSVIYFAVATLVLGMFAFWQAAPVYACDGGNASVSFTFVVTDATVDITGQAENSCGASAATWNNFLTGYSWDFDDSNSASVDGFSEESITISTSHTFTAAGTYNVCVAVTTTNNWSVYDTTQCQSVTIDSVPVVVVAPETSAVVEVPIPVAPTAPDRRINWQYGDTSTVVFSNPSPVNSAMQLELYCWDADESVAWLAFVITEDTVADFSVNGEKQLIEEYNEGDCYAEFWMLEDGQYQVNIYTEDGKIYELLDWDLDFTDSERRYFDPNE